MNIAASRVEIVDSVNVNKMLNCLRSRALNVETIYTYINRVVLSCEWHASTVSETLMSTTFTVHYAIFAYA